MNIQLLRTLVLSAAAIGVAIPAVSQTESSSPWVSDKSNAETTETWLKSLPLPGLADQFTEPLSQKQLHVLATLRAEPEFEEFLSEVGIVGRLNFSRYFAWQIQNVRSEKAADAPIFVHTIMNDLARLKTFSEEEIIQIRFERERQYETLLDPVRQKLEEELWAHKLGQKTVDSVMETFEKSVIDTKAYLTNPACAFCDLPATPEITRRMQRYQEENLSRITKIINDSMAHPTTDQWRLVGLKFKAAQIEYAVASDFAGRMAWRDEAEVENPESPARRVLQPGPYAIFFPVEWDSLSYWKATGSGGTKSGMSSGGYSNPEPNRSVCLRYMPDEDYPDRKRYESVYDQPVED